jgi:hypothetical protein
MLRARLAKRSNQVKYGKLAVAVLAAVAFCLAHPASTTFAKSKKKKPAYGIVKIQTVPAGFPLDIDGKPQGSTTSEYREFELEPGRHTIVISLPSGRRWSREISIEAARRKCVVLNYRPPAPRAASPCPYPVNLSAPVSVAEGDVITFTADAAYSGTAALNYTWNVSPSDARIISGAGTPTISVDSTGFGGRKIVATLVVDDGSGEAACRQAAQAATMVPPPPPPVEHPAREFDVCCTCSYDDQKARLDNLAIELQNDPSTTTYIIAYAGRTSRAGTADRLLTRARDYLVQKRAVDQSRIVSLNGGYREEDCVELWLVPRGATPPQPTPTVQAGEARPAPDTAAPKKKRRG